MTIMVNYWKNWGCSLRDDRIMENWVTDSVARDLSLLGYMGEHLFISTTRYNILSCIRKLTDVCRALVLQMLHVSEFYAVIVNWVSTLNEEQFIKLQGAPSSDASTAVKICELAHMLAVKHMSYATQTSQPKRRRAANRKLIPLITTIMMTERSSGYIGLRKRLLRQAKQGS